MYTMRLGGYGPQPSDAPQPGFQWLRYNAADGSGQARTCPSPAPYGCFLRDGYAWGQIPYERSELVDAATPTSTGIPQDVQDRCNSAYAQWARMYPAQAQCMNAEDAHRFRMWCLDAAVHPERSTQYSTTWAALVEQRCAARTPPPQPPPPPPAQSPPPPSRSQCETALSQWAQYFPEQARCLQSGDVPTLASWCSTMPAPEFRTRMDDLVAQRCRQAQQPPPPNAPPPIPPPTAPPVAPPPMYTPPPNGGDTPPTPPVQKPSLLRQVGPIVGIGLLAAIVLTVTRK